MDAEQSRRLKVKQFSIFFVRAERYIGTNKKPSAGMNSQGWLKLISRVYLELAKIVLGKGPVGINSSNWGPNLMLVWDFHRPAVDSYVRTESLMKLSQHAIISTLGLGVLIGGK